MQVLLSTSSVNTLGRHTIAFALCTLSLFAGIIPGSMHPSTIASASSTPDQVSDATTIDFDQGSRLTQSWNASASGSTDSSLVGISVSTTTPSAGYGSLAVPTVSDGLTHSTLWSWPSYFGNASGAEAGEELTANNSTTTFNVTLPVHSDITQAFTYLSTTSGSVSGTYAVSLSVDGSSIIAINGNRGFGTIAPLLWSNKVNGIASFATGREPNGSELSAIGEQGGNLTLFQSYPGVPGRVIYSVGLAPPAPVTAVAIGPFYLGANLSVAAAAGNDVFVITPTARGWAEYILQLPSSVGSLDTVSDIAIVQYPTGNPGVVVAVPLKGLFVTNLTGYGPDAAWENPLVTLMGTIGTGPIYLASSFTGTLARLGVGEGSHVETLDMSGMATNVSSSTVLPSNDTVSAIIFDAEGSNLFIASQLGILRVESIGKLGSPNVIYQGNATITSLDYFASPSLQLLGLLTASGTVAVIESPLGLSHTLIVGNFQDLGHLTTLDFGALNSSTGDDLVIASSGLLYSIPSTLTFNSTIVSGWKGALQNAVNSASNNVNLGSEQSVRIPVTLSATDSSIHLMGTTIEYNVTQQVSLGLTGNYTRSPSTGVVNLPLLVSARSFGTLHLTVIFSFLAPPTPGSVTWFSSGFVWLSRQLSPWVDSIVMSTLFVGAVLVSLGTYFHSYRPNMKRPTIASQKSVFEAIVSDNRPSRHASHGHR